MCNILFPFVKLVLTNLAYDKLQMTTDEKWSFEVMLELGELLLCSINDSRITPGSIHHSQWPIITRQENSLVGKSKTIKQCKDKYK